MVYLREAFEAATTTDPGQERITLVPADGGARDAEAATGTTIDTGAAVDVAASGPVRRRTRDARDEGRAIAPLKKADGAVLVDSTSMSIDETVAAMLGKVREVAGR